MLLSQLLKELSVDLNDHESGYEFTRWTKSQLTSYVREIVATLLRGSFNKYFSQQIVLKVEPGMNWQSICDSCTSLKNIVGECDKHGRLLKPLAKIADDSSLVWVGKNNCKVAPKDYVMTGYKISSTVDDMFKVVPDMPLGADRYVLADCYVEPDYSSDENVPDKLVGIIKQWVLYRALSVDSENSPSIVELARTHLSTFESLYNLALIQENKDDYRNSPNENPTSN